MTPYPIIAPDIPSGDVYKFTTKFDVEYEVRFGRKKDNILHIIVVFGVLNDEYDGEEYVVTTKGDVFRVMTTIAEIIKMFLHEHQHTEIFEFNGILRENGMPDSISQRTLLYLRYLPTVFSPDEWKTQNLGNEIVVKSIKSKA
jgi:hypothetical protein